VLRNQPRVLDLQARNARLSRAHGSTSPRTASPITCPPFNARRGITARFWMNLQASYELEIAEDQLGEKVMREVFPRTAA
jgi:hypothetical protein